KPCREGGLRGRRDRALGLRGRLPRQLLPAQPAVAREGVKARREALTMRIAYITAGAAGMFCGSCMRDNTLVTALARLGHEALLIPTYTPIRTDEDDVSQKRILFGGINF